jgi:hypothetical protein
MQAMPWILAGYRKLSEGSGGYTIRHVIRGHRCGPMLAWAGPPRQGKPFGGAGATVEARSQAASCSQSCTAASPCTLAWARIHSPSISSVSSRNPRARGSDAELCPHAEAERTQRSASVRPKDSGLCCTLQHGEGRIREEANNHVLARRSVGRPQGRKDSVTIWLGRRRFYAPCATHPSQGHQLNLDVAET